MPLPGTGALTFRLEPETRGGGGGLALVGLVVGKEQDCC